MARKRKSKGLWVFFVLLFLFFIIIAGVALFFIFSSSAPLVAENGGIMMRAIFYNSQGQDVSGTSQTIVNGVPQRYYMSIQILSSNTGNVPLTNIRFQETHPDTLTQALQNTNAFQPNLSVGESNVLQWDTKNSCTVDANCGASEKCVQNECLIDISNFEGQTSFSATILIDYQDAQNQMFTLSKPISLNVLFAEDVTEEGIFIDSNINADCVTYSVSQRNCNNGTYTAFKYLSNAIGSINNINEPRTLLFREGEYIVQPPLVVYKNNLVMKPYNYENVVIRGGIAQWQTMIKFKGNNIIIDSITFIGNYNQLYAPTILEFVNWESGSSNIKILNSKFFDNQGNDDIGYNQRTPAYLRGWGNLIYFYKVNEIEIKNSEFSCIRDTNRMTPDRFQGDGVLCDYCEDALIENNKFENCPHILLTFRSLDSSIGIVNRIVVRNNDFSNKFHTNLAFVGTNVEIYNNKIHDFNEIPSYLTLTPPTGAGIQFGGVPHPTSNNLIYNNLIYNGGYLSSGITIRGGTTSVSSTTNNKIYHNTIYNMGESGIYLSNPQGTGGNTGIYDNKFYNNLIYGVGISTRTNVNAPLVLVFDNLEENNGYGNEFKNNLIMPFDNREAIKSSNTITPRYVYTAEQFNELSFADDNIGVIPPFISAENNLDLSSELQGICVSEVTTDFNGNARSGVCSIGAFEYG